MKFIATWDNVLIELPKPETKTKTGLILPETMQNNELGGNSCIGTIASIGQEVNEAFSIGRKVVFRSTDGTPITINETKYVLVSQTDIIGFAEENDADTNAKYC